MAAIELGNHFTYKRLLKFTWPSIAMMIFSSIYGVVDGFFVSNYAGRTSFAAVNLIMPVILIAATVGFMFGSGGSAIVAKTLGEGDVKKANSYFSLFIYTTIVIQIVVGTLLIIFLRPIAQLLGAEGELLDDCVIYGRICLAALPFFSLQLLFQSFMITASRPQMGFKVTVAAGLTNMVLDTLLVGLLPLQYKLAGAAIATAVSQTVGAIVPLIFFLRRNNGTVLRLGKTSFDGRALLKAATNGSSEFMSNISMSFVSILFNSQLLSLAGENGVAAYGVLMYVSMIFNAAFIGYSIGTAPVFSYHFGAKNRAELQNLLKKSLLMIGIFGVCMTAASEALAVPLSGIFVGYDAELLAITVRGFRIFSFSFLFMGFAIFGSGFFTALNDGLTSALISFLRTLVFEVAAVLTLPPLLGIDGIWLSLVAAEFMAMVLSAAFMLIKRRRYGY